MSQEKTKASLPLRMAISAVGGCAAATFCHPLDTLKVHMQVRGNVQYKSLTDAAVTIVRNEGLFTGLYAGVSAAYLRQWTYGACRVGIFSHLMAMTGKDKASVTIVEKLGMGLFSGGIGAFLGTPAELALVRMTADSKLPPAERQHYRHVFDCLGRAIKTGGVGQMWTGAGPTVARSMLLSASMLASYSEFKALLHRTQPSVFTQDGLLTMFCGTMMGSLVANTVVNPVDVIKSRIQMRPGDYDGMIDCFRKSIRSDGVTVLARGFVPAFVKLAPYTCISLIVTEKISLAVMGSAAV